MLAITQVTRRTQLRDVSGIVFRRMKTLGPHSCLEATHGPADKLTTIRKCLYSQKIEFCCSVLTFVNRGKPNLVTS